MDNSNREESTLIEFRERFSELISSHYFIRTPIPIAPSTVPQFHINEQTLFVCPEIDLQELIILQKSKTEIKCKDSDIFWYVNFKRFHQEFRDSLMISAIEKKIDTNAGECFKFILQQMYTRTEPWQIVKNY